MEKLTERTIVITASVEGEDKKLTKRCTYVGQDDLSDIELVLKSSRHFLEWIENSVEYKNSLR